MGEVHLRHLSILRTVILLCHCLVVLVRVADDNLAHLRHARGKLLLGVAGVVVESGAPGLAVGSTKGHRHSTGGDLRRLVVEHGVLLEHALREVVGEVADGVRGLGCLEVALQEDQRSGDGEVELQGVEDGALHSQNLGAVVGAVGDVDKVSDLCITDGTVLRAKEERRERRMARRGMAR